MNFERSSHPKPAQIDALLRFLESNPSLAKGFPKIPSARDAVRKHWERMASELNSMEGSAKSWKQWTKYWADKKSAVKKKAALRQAALLKTDGGTEETLILSEVEERIVSLMVGKSYVEGDPLAIHQLSGPQSRMEKDDLFSSVPLKGEPAANMMNSFDNHSVSPTQSFVPEMPAEFSSPSIEEDNVTIPSKQGIFPRHYTPYLRQPPLRNSSPRRRSRIPNSAASQRRSQLLYNTTDRFVRMEEQRLSLERRNTEVLEALARIAANQMESSSTTNIAIAQALTSIGDGLKMLAERSSCRCRRINGNSDEFTNICPALDSHIKVELSREND